MLNARFMRTYLKQMQQHANQSSAMETGDHSKNGASPKSHTSRGNVKLFVLFAFFALFGLNAIAQDVIVTKDAKKINAKVTEVDIDHIKYKSFKNQDGPTYTLLKSAVSSILYQNGAVEIFSEDKTSPELTPAALVALLGLNAIAQDVIVTKDEKKINAKVTEVYIDNIKYKRIDNLDGPTYTLPKSAISSILYQNGNVETFGDDKTSSGLTPTPTPATSTPSTSASSTRTQPTQRRRAFSYLNMRTDDPLLYQRYAVGQSQATMGWVSTAIGIAGVGIGVGDAIYSGEVSGKGGIYFGV
jgi:hypothetical protein